MLKHIVLFKFHPALSQQQITDVLDGFHVLRIKLPGIHSCRFGVNNSMEGFSRGFTHCMEMEIEDADARQNYLAHPLHVAFATTKVIPALEDGLNTVVVFDYEFTP